MTKRLKLVINLVLILIAITSCGDKNDFPNQIQTKKTNKHIRIEGTKVFGIIPSDFRCIRELGRYQKNKNLYVQIIESNASNFTEAKPNFTKQNIEANGSQIGVLSPTKLNEYEAIYLEGPSNDPDETKIMLVFGDKSFVVTIVGVCKTTDTEGKEELQKIFKSIYYDKSLQLDPLELANFEFDQTITNFKYAMTASNIFIYAENGESDIQNPLANIFQIQVMPQMTEEQAEHYANDLSWRYEQDGVKLNIKTITKTKINNRTAYVLETKTSNDNNKGALYQAVLVFENTTIVFIGVAQHDTDDYLTKFKKTAKSIRLK